MVYANEKHVRQSLASPEMNAQLHPPHLLSTLLLHAGVMQCWAGEECACVCVRGSTRRTSQQFLAHSSVESRAYGWRE